MALIIARKVNLKLFGFFILFFSTSLHAQNQVVCGAEQFPLYLPFLRDVKIMAVVNQTSRVGNVHLIDTLLKHKVNIIGILAPEHGFRGNHGAGELVNSEIDSATKIPLISLYGKNKKPKAEDIKKANLVIFDIQDVGARFYTYISTLHYVMQACAEQNIPMLILDRPNPHGHYVDGPVLDLKHQSFVGMHPVPVVHGLTIGEYAQMINEEGWLGQNLRCNLEIIKVANYTHHTFYQLPVPPSPNLPNQRAIALYPSLCFFEGTPISVGRGTPWPFQIIGQPNSVIGSFNFTPVAIKEAAPNPPYKNQPCLGFNFTSSSSSPYSFDSAAIAWQPLIDFYKANQPNQYFTKFFTLLAGGTELQQWIQQGKTEAEIRKLYKQKPEYQQYLAIRKKYLLYPDFD